MGFRKTSAILLALALTVPLAACTKAKSEDKTERVLRIATVNTYGPDDQNFRNQFTDLFEFANPNIKIELVQLQDPYQYMYNFGKQPGQQQKQPDPFETMKQSMTEANPPDVVMVNFDQLADLVQNNLVAPLDPLIAKDKFDTTGIVPAVLDGLKAAGDGKLYGLSPTFNSTALIYNKAMFDEVGVPYPKDNMTWDEMFDLARRVSHGDGADRKYGFSFTPQNGGDLFYSMQNYTMPLQLRMMDDKGEHMTVDSDQWEKVWQTFIQLQKDNILPSPPDYSKPQPPLDPAKQGPFSYDNFMSGRVAMTIENYGQLTQLINANQNADKIQNYTKIDWDVVTLPSHPENPGVVAGVSPSGVFAINAKAGNPDDAWKLISFINGEQYAKLKGSSSYQLSSRKAYIKPPGGLQFHVEAFYNVKPTTFVNEFVKLSRDKPNINMVQTIGRQEFQSALSGQVSVRDALKAWQTKGDALLQQIKDNPNGPIDMSKFMGSSNGSTSVSVPLGK